MAEIYSRGREIVERGKKGYNVGLYNGFSRINERLHGVKRSMYYLLGAESGVGKTTLTDSMFMIFPYLYHVRKMKQKVKWFYYSFEISQAVKEISLATLFYNYVGGLHISADILKGEAMDKTNRKIPIPPEALLKEELIWQEVNDMLKCVTFYDEPKTGKQIEQDIMEYCEANGKFKIRKRIDDKGKEISERYYEPNDPNEYLIVIVDSLNLLETGKENPKNAIDKASSTFVKLRNTVGCTIVAIQQFNTDLMSAQRAKAHNRNVDHSAIRPQRIDFGDSKYPYRDADYVIGGVNPLKYDIETYMGYPIYDNRGVYLGESFNYWHLMKNRHGMGGGGIPTIRNTHAPVVWEMPLAKDISGGLEGFMSWTKPRIITLPNIDRPPVELIA